MACALWPRVSRSQTRSSSQTPWNLAGIPGFWRNPWVIGHLTFSRGGAPGSADRNPGSADWNPGAVAFCQGRRRGHWERGLKSQERGPGPRERGLAGRDGGWIPGAWAGRFGGFQALFGAWTGGWRGWNAAQAGRRGTRKLGRRGAAGWRAWWLPCPNVLCQIYSCL